MSIVMEAHVYVDSVSRTLRGLLSATQLRVSDERIRASSERIAISMGTDCGKRFSQYAQHSAQGGRMIRHIQKTSCHRDQSSAVL